MIILLLIAGSILIILNVRALKKEKSSFKFNLDSAGDHMEEFEVGLGQLRKEFSETILELQMEIQSLDEKFSKEKTNVTSPKKSENNAANSVKINEIEKLSSQGLTIEEIAKKLGMGKGEVLLIKQLYIK